MKTRIFQTLPVVAVVLLSVLAAPAVHAQSVGDILGKAKDKIKEATGGSAKGDAKQSPDGAAGQKKGSTSSDEDAAMTLEGERQKVITNTADKRPVDPAQRTYLDSNFSFRRLTVNDKFPIKFTSDDAAIRAFIDENEHPWTMMNALATDLETGIHYNDRSSYLKAGLHKVKEIHFTTTSQRHDANNKGGGPYLYSFNPATGILTAALVTVSRLEDASAAPHEFSEDVQINGWILAHMTAAPKPRKIDNSIYVGNGSSSSGSSAPASGQAGSVKKWTCTWCHETVESADKPDYHGCTVEKAHEHSWHAQ